MKIEHDQDAESPRMWSNMGTLITCHAHSFGDSIEHNAELGITWEGIYAKLEALV